MHHAMGERVGLSGTSPRDDKEWLIATVLHSVTLFRIKRCEIGLSHCAVSESLTRLASTHFGSSANRTGVLKN
jgi:hypothetical protein